MARQRMTTRKQATREDKLRRLEHNYSEFTGGEISVKHAYLKFRLYQEAKGNSKDTLLFYDRCFHMYQYKSRLLYRFLIQSLGSLSMLQWIYIEHL